MPAQPAIFLDRDGVIIENRDEYVRTWGDVAIFPQAVTALQQIASLPYRIIMITNQSGVGRGAIPLGEAEAINQRLVQELAFAGGRVDGVYMCPHAPSANCPCRKPQPGMILDAARAFNLDLARSLLIGDALTDLEAGARAGIPTLALVRTGRGRREESRLTPRAAHVFDDLLAAVSTLLGNPAVSKFAK
jgi:D-glycero-D-manno-heptose 1,7-bisphosphate phosphatase